MLLCTTLIAGCSHLREQVSTEPDGWQLQQERNGTIDAWYISGRLGVKTEQQNGSLDIFWNQQGERYQIRLIAPFGQGAYFIYGEAGKVTIVDAKGGRHTSDNADELFAAYLGVRLPLSSLQHWLRGLPAAAPQRLQWDEAGMLYIVEQLGWRVEMARYAEASGYMLPYAFYLSRADQPELSVQLRLGQWQLHELPALEPAL